MFCQTCWKSEIVDIVRVGLVVCRDFHAHRAADPLIDLGQIIHQMGDLISLHFFYFVALLIYGSDRPGSLGVGHKAVHKGLEPHLVRLLSAEIQNIKNGLDPVGVKAFPIFQQAVDLLRHAVQHTETLPHLQHILPVLRGDFT